MYPDPKKQWSPDTAHHLWDGQGAPTLVAWEVLLGWTKERQVQGLWIAGNTDRGSASC